LTSAQKRRIGRKVHEGKASLSAVSRKYKLNVKTVHKYHKMVQKGVSIYCNDGRPPALDLHSQLEIKNWVDIWGCESISDLRDLVREEYKKSFQRKYQYMDEGSRPVFRLLSWRSVARYAKMFSSGVFSDRKGGADQADDDSIA
jgi:hypothetical protein